MFTFKTNDGYKGPLSYVLTVRLLIAADQLTTMNITAKSASNSVHINVNAKMVVYYHTDIYDKYQYYIVK